MSLEGKVLEILAEREANAREIASELGTDSEKIVEVLRRLKAAGLLLEIDER